ncbi:MAG: VWA domain-containing protein [Verrucomicrobiae bacterium]|nr:VWA domain-containing protein [Verrucomicrobiae bacterium]
MKFLSPLAFLFAVSIPVVILFYLLKRKRVVKLVPSTVLWQRFLADTQASAPFQKLRKNWLLYLQILLLALAVLALARPFFPTEAKPARLRVVILDGSASMQATDESPSRFEKARAEALRWVDALQPGDQMVILLAGANTEVKQPATSDKAALRRALLACAPSDAPTRLLPALRLADSLVRDHRSAEVHLFSDGAADDLREFTGRTLPLIYHKLGHRAENLALIALDSRPHPDEPNLRVVYTAVASFASNTLRADLELFFQAADAATPRLLETRVLTVQPGQTAKHAFTVEQRADGIFTARLVGRDDLAADDEAFVVSLLPRAVNVLLLTRGNRLLEKALRAVPNVQLTVATDLTDPAERFDFVVLDGVTPTVWPKGNVLAFRVANTNWIERLTELESPALVDWKATHPLLRYVSFDAVLVAKSLAPAESALPAWALPVLEASRAALILAGERGRQRIVWVGFDPLESNWPLRVSFPIFIANAVEWLNPANARLAQLFVRAGDPFRLPLTEPLPTAEVKLPDGSTRTLKLDTNATELVFGETARRGVYQVRLGTNSIPFCANLLDPAESNILPRDELKFGESASVPATTVQRTNYELWRTLAALGLGLLLLEWWWYHKRTV